MGVQKYSTVTRTAANSTYWILIFYLRPGVGCIAFLLLWVNALNAAAVGDSWQTGNRCKRR
jgi:hypothetical protein